MVKRDDWEIGWRRIEIDEVKGSRRGIVPDGAWEGIGEFEWQIVLRESTGVGLGSPEVSRRFELTCDELASLGGWFFAFGSFDEAITEAERFEDRARSRRIWLGTAGTRGVVLWPESWEILGSSNEITDGWRCPYCGSQLPAYKVEMACDRSQGWFCSKCSMPLEWRESPERFRVSGIELDRLEAVDMERDWGLTSTVVDDRHFLIDDPIEGSAVQELRHVWLPPYLTTRTVLCFEEGSDGVARCVCFVNDQQRVAILIEASENRKGYLGYYIDFGSLTGMLDLIEAWETGKGWLDQLPDPQVFWFEQGKVRPDHGIDMASISRLFGPTESWGS